MRATIHDTRSYERYKKLCLKLCPNNQSGEKFTSCTNNNGAVNSQTWYIQMLDLRLITVVGYPVLSTSRTKDRLQNRAMTWDMNLEWRSWPRWYTNKIVLYGFCSRQIKWFPISLYRPQWNAQLLIKVQPVTALAMFCLIVVSTIIHPSIFFTAPGAILWLP